MKFIVLLTSIFIFSSCAQIIQSNVNGKDVTYQINDLSYEGYYIKASTQAPLILLVHDWDGLTAYEKKRSKMLADLGYSVFAVDMFGKGIRPEEVAERRKLTRGLYADRPKMRLLMNGALQKAKSLGLNTSNAVALGYCFGGTSILELAKSGANLKGFASFHGNLGVKQGESYSATKGKIAVFHGTADTAVSMDDFAGLAKLLETENVPHEMITYSGAPHAFTVFGRDRYRKDADEKSWARFTSFLKETL